MSFKNTHIIKSSLYVSTAEEVQSAAASLKLTFPPGYQEYVTTLGDGEYCGYVRVLLPSQVLAEYRDWQKLWKEYFFWDEEEGGITKGRVIECIRIAYTIDGDSLVFHPENPAELFVLPRNDDFIHRIGSSLGEALDWVCESGVLVQKIKSRFFVPWSWLERNGHTLP
jgi:hypothetical protein